MNCPKCSSELKEVPAGVSKKTGKPYNAFIACSNRDCKYTENIKAQARPIPQPSEKDELIKWLAVGKIAAHLSSDYEDWKIKSRAVHDYIVLQSKADSSGEVNVEDVPF